MRNPNIVVTDMIAKYNEDSSNPFYIDLMFTVADSDATKQAAQISDMINAGCDVISIFAVDTTAVLSSVQEATEAGIPHYRNRHQSCRERYQAHRHYHVRRV